MTTDVEVTRLDAFVRCCALGEGERLLEFSLVARRGLLLRSGEVRPTYVAVTEDDTLGGLLAVLAGYHGFSSTSPITLHADPPQLPGPVPLRLERRSCRYRFGAIPCTDDQVTVQDGIPVGTTGYLCVGNGQWLWYLSALPPGPVGHVSEILRVIGHETRRVLDTA